MDLFLVIFNFGQISDVDYFEERKRKNAYSLFRPTCKTALVWNKRVGVFSWRFAFYLRRVALICLGGVPKWSLARIDEDEYSGVLLVC